MCESSLRACLVCHVYYAFYSFLPFSGSSDGTVCVWRIAKPSDRQNVKNLVKSLLTSELERSKASSAKLKTVGRGTAPVDTTPTAMPDLRGNDASAENANGEQKIKTNTRAQIYKFEDVLKFHRRNGRLKDNNDSPCSHVFQATGHYGVVSSLSFSPTANFLASGCDTGIVNIWSLQV